MYNLPSWKTYTDDWNKYIFELNNKNKENAKYLLDVNIANNDKKNDNIGNMTNNIDNNQNNNKLIDIENIINNTNYKTREDIDILKNMTSISTWLLENHNINNNTYNYFLTVLQWQIEALKYFINELNIKQLYNKTHTLLIRSSYKLCNSKADCKYHYPDDIINKKGCNHQHYPYAQLYMDCLSVYNYIYCYYNKNTTSKANKLMSIVVQQYNEFDNVNLNKCLRTINYVINSIYKELENIIRYRSKDPDFNIRNYHYHYEKKYNNNK